jgi:molybdopterin-biosynthesis enzyme MoeA-like protein
MAGVPQIMRAMFDGIRHDLKGGRPMLSRTVSSHLAEGTLAKDLSEIQERFPDVEIGSYPFYRQGQFGVSLVLRGTDAGRLDQAAEAVAAMIRRLGGSPVEETAT